MIPLCQCPFETESCPAPKGELAGVVFCKACKLPKPRDFVPDAFSLGAELGDRKRCAEALRVSKSTLDRAYAANPRLLARVEGQVRGHWPTMLEQFFPNRK